MPLEKEPNSQTNKPWHAHKARLMGLNVFFSALIGFGAHGFKSTSNPLFPDLQYLSGYSLLGTGLLIGLGVAAWLATVGALIYDPTRQHEKKSLESGSIFSLAAVATFVFVPFAVSTSLTTTIVIALFALLTAGVAIHQGRKLFKLEKQVVANSKVPTDVEANSKVPTDKVEKGLTLKDVPIHADVKGRRLQADAVEKFAMRCNSNQADDYRDLKNLAMKLRAPELAEQNPPFELLSTEIFQSLRDSQKELFKELSLFFTTNFSSREQWVGKRKMTYNYLADYMMGPLADRYYPIPKALDNLAVALRFQDPKNPKSEDTPWVQEMQKVSALKMPKLKEDDEDKDKDPEHVLATRLTEIFDYLPDSLIAGKITPPGDAALSRQIENPGKPNAKSEAQPPAQPTAPITKEAQLGRINNLLEEYLGENGVLSRMPPQPIRESKTPSPPATSTPPPTPTEAAQSLKNFITTFIVSMYSNQTSSKESRAREVLWNSISTLIHLYQMPKLEKELIDTLNSRPPPTPPFAAWARFTGSSTPKIREPFSPPTSKSFPNSPSL